MDYQKFIFMFYLTDIFIDYKLISKTISNPKELSEYCGL